ncbi:putative anti-sigma-YlaC factor YlaD [Pseudonocardia hierapolitana]|uniref:Putative anti-sigma-YlaC factor YlaD n=1 Tax=Pseudonocardia hierapolitana TaxID=1128676 RepID=A0A561T413_9PSEU|nr:zf-HC2 domain-containing protein [Pseudonocardia hierapolitana]TWF81839.1 putative anti-sigma-YlaC factor YlaD [Pseudonocardia hierapolitana]
MRCEDFRDAISARMDGEDPGMEAAEVERHLAGCAGCRAFSERAAHVTRLARIRPAEDHPDVLPGLLAALDAGESRPAPRRTGRSIARDAVRAALAVLAVGQLALALSGIIAATGAGPDQLAGASMAHFSHESAAWNLAIGVAFGWAATGARRAGGLVPVIGAFVALLVTLSALDVLAGHVTAGRLLGHLPVIIGLVLLLLHARLGRDGGGTTAASHEGETGDGSHGDETFGGGRFGDGGLQPSAHHRAA